MDSVLDELGAMGTSVRFVPQGCTGIAQPLDGGVMSPLKTPLRQTCAEAAVANAMPTNSAERRRYLFDHAMDALIKISTDTLRHSFDKAGPFFGCGTSTDVQGMLDDSSLMSVVDAQDDDTSRVYDVLSGGVNESASEEISVCGEICGQNEACIEIRSIRPSG
ncbi:hypothetical protein PF005_g7930 [Phytophthora fragariae]|uniref:Uncharacterized protein n=1 Tax=Phytophthora fragariae TaxID=53985 RepID=A0A6A3UAZ9_9STRA|nr:hypothetical protein PF003_g23851 [Phytophthora fragariae]KAE8940971.1 hypothetical protein PF009_g9235 [Phytophthora fragariae]KAE9009913.1 hypothetical protein PF011_g10053 [Phytophthora fragariae]KAE9114264.1 hypothetical protein PF007_g10447 [Phytophthora fragariae]KAE9117574.1 hypothetical protein PF010_g8557 [Phytophthora fragariae]